MDGFEKHAAANDEVAGINTFGNVKLAGMKAAEGWFDEVQCSTGRGFIFCFERLFELFATKTESNVEDAIFVAKICHFRVAPLTGHGGIRPERVVRPRLATRCNTSDLGGTYEAPACYYSRCPAVKSRRKCLQNMSEDDGTRTRNHRIDSPHDHQHRTPGKQGKRARPASRVARGLLGSLRTDSGC
ncbi:MAG: hypothetical protein C0467_17645 [Planctomycetaceae bacterium]|nr:hypothetical protein [Planctomycetaceae bacterium]